MKQKVKISNLEGKTPKVFLIFLVSVGGKLMNETFLWSTQRRYRRQNFQSNGLSKEELSSDCKRGFMDCQ
jgi:hypothetical protein